MTVRRRDNNDTEFGNWMRTHPLLKSNLGYDAENLDYIWFAFRNGWFILIEEKRYNASQSLPQSDTHGIIHQSLENTLAKLKVTTWRGKREIKYRGYYLIQFEKTNPNDSEWIKINNQKHNKGDLLYLLRCGELLNIDWSLPSPLIAKNNDLSYREVAIIKSGLV